MPSNINQQQLQVATIQNSFVPDGGPKAIPLILDFTGSVLEYDLDLQNLQSRGFFELVQTMFIDLAGAANDLHVVIGGAGQTIIAKAGTQGYYPVLSCNPIKLSFTQSASPGDLVKVYLMNTAVAGQVWTA